MDRPMVRFADEQNIQIKIQSNETSDELAQSPDEMIHNLKIIRPS